MNAGAKLDWSAAFSLKIVSPFLIKTRLSKPRLLRVAFGVFALLIVSLIAHTQAFGASESVVWSFDGVTEGGNPQAGLVMDSSGDLFGTTAVGGTYDCGTVFELIPPSTSGGNWTESTLWTFDDYNGQDGAAPYAGLLMDKSGNLYGTTTVGGAHAISGDFGGTVFELTPPSTPGGKWTESILWSFGNDANDGQEPYGNIIMDKSGNLYGTTRNGGAYAMPDNGGTVFKLTPPTPEGKWTESILWSFGNGTDGNQPLAGLIMDARGNLYGTTFAGGSHSDGTVFELTPPSIGGGKWTESILRNFYFAKNGFEPHAGLIMDSHRNLYGTTLLGASGSGGTVFRLTPPSTTAGIWTYSVLWNFNVEKDGGGLYGGVIMDTRGNLYGTTSTDVRLGAGTVFKLKPPSTIGDAWSESTVWSFDITDGYSSHAGLIMDANGNLYGTTFLGGTHAAGTVFEVTNTGSSKPTSSPTPTPAATPTPGGTISLSADPVDFPNAGLGEAPTPKTLVVQNLSAKHALVGDVGGPLAPFSITSGAGAFDLGPLGMLKVKMMFTPTGLGLAKGSLVVTSNDKAKPSVTVNLQGTGEPGRLATSIPVALDNTLAFGQVPIDGTPKSASFKIENIGTGDLKGNVGALAAPFSVTAGGGAFNLAPGATEKVTVQFAPKALGHVSQLLAIIVTAPSKPPAGITISVSGKGT